jgi:hypothetical protein
MIIEKIGSKGVEPINFERPLSPAYWWGKSWSRKVLERVFLSVNMIPSINRTLEPQAIEQALEAIREKLLEYTDVKLNISTLRAHKEKVVLVFPLNTCDRGLLTRGIRLREQAKLRAAKIADVRQAAQQVLRSLEDMRKEEDEPDFRHSPTTYAYDITEKIVKDSYTHYIGSAPVPTVGPDGEGGIVLEWKSAGRSVVRMIIPSSGDKKSYIYSRGVNRSEVDYSVSALTLARQLRSTFAD